MYNINSKRLKWEELLCMSSGKEYTLINSCIQDTCDEKDLKKGEKEILPSFSHNPVEEKQHSWQEYWS